MAKCKNCKHLDYAENVLEYGINKIPYCFFNEDIEDVCEERECFAFEVITNADRIRSMTDEELAKFLFNVNSAYAEPCMTGEYGHTCKWEDYPTHDKGCKDCFLEWLKSEVGCE